MLQPIPVITYIICRHIVMLASLLSNTFHFFVLGEKDMVIVYDFTEQLDSFGFLKIVLMAIYCFNHLLYKVSDLHFLNYMTVDVIDNFVVLVRL